jgi:hypothetical protein
MKNYQIVDNFLATEEFEKIQSVMIGNSFPWYFGPVIMQPTEYSKIDENYNFQFFHIFYKDFQPSSELFRLMYPLIEKINPKCILRIKANVAPRTDEIVEHGFHIDFENACTCVFYLNTNNGYTKFDDGTIVNSLENRAVFFDSNIRHTGTTATDISNRMVININYIGH